LKEKITPLPKVSKKMKKNTSFETKTRDVKKKKASL